VKEELKNYKWNDLYEWIDIKKGRGNSEYKAKEFKSALKSYISGLLAIQYDNSKEHTNRMNEKLRLDLLNNVIATLLECKSYKQGIIVTNKALTLYPDNLKMLNRRGKCYFMLGDYSKARFFISYNNSIDLMKAKEIAKVTNPEMIEEIEAFIKRLPEDIRTIPKEQKKMPKILGSLYEDKGEEEQERLMLTKLSNIQWILYPFKKMIMSFLYRIIGKKYKYE